jgi:hypothetical protein
LRGHLGVLRDFLGGDALLAEVALKQDDMIGAEAILLRAKQRCAADPRRRCYA